MVVVTIAQGKLKGGETKSDSGTSYYEFLGVPYAKPPVGDLRFSNPQAPEPWDGERDATSINSNNICCQIDPVGGKVVGSEDCLYLNVYTPNKPDSNTKSLPVMVFIHGGGFIYGKGIAKEELGPDYLIDNDVVVVTLNYRIGAAGFLSLGIPEAPGNMGLKDQVFALKWVQNNIEKFGGDPNNVTIFGISAGSASVECHLLSPLSKGLFHKAILQSGSILNHWSVNYEPNKLNEKLLKYMGYDGPMSDNNAIYKYLVSSPISKIIEASFKAVENFTQDRLYFGFVPTIEKDFNDGQAMITEYPYKLITEGRLNHVPIIRGYCNKEGYVSNALKPSCSLAFIEKKNFTDHLAFELEANDKNEYNAKFLEAYLENTQPDDEKDKMAVEFFSDLDFVAGIWVSAEMFASQGVPQYMYEFGYDGKINFFKSLFGLMRKGASHGDDLCYLFRHDMFSQAAVAKDIEVRSNICKLWTNFAKTSNPIPDSELPIQWPQFSNDSQAYLCIYEDFAVNNAYEPKKIAIFKNIYGKYEK